MKVNFENGVATYSGKYDEVVYQDWFQGRLCLARKYAYPTLVKVHEDMKEISSNLNALYLAADAAYVSDFKLYSQKNARENVPRVKRFLHPMPTSKSLFIHCMWEWYDSDPEHIDLKTVTIADMITLESPVTTVKKSVDAGYLKKVTGYESMSHPIGT